MSKIAQTTFDICRRRNSVSHYPPHPRKEKMPLVPDEYYIISRDVRDFFINQSRFQRAQLSRQICSAGKNQAVVS